MPWLVIICQFTVSCITTFPAYIVWNVHDSFCPCMRHVRELTSCIWQSLGNASYTRNKTANGLKKHASNAAEPRAGNFLTSNLMETLEGSRRVGVVYHLVILGQNLQPAAFHSIDFTSSSSNVTLGSFPPDSIDARWPLLASSEWGKYGFPLQQQSFSPAEMAWDRCCRERTCTSQYDIAVQYGTPVYIYRCELRDLVAVWRLVVIYLYLMNRGNI